MASLPLHHPRPLLRLVAPDDTFGPEVPEVTPDPSSASTPGGWSNDPLLRPQYRGSVTDSGPPWARSMELLRYAVPNSIRRSRCLWCGEWHERESDWCCKDDYRLWTRWYAQHTRLVRHCDHCGQALRKKRRKYCDDACKQAAYRARIGGRS